MIETLQAADPRVKILLALILGVLVWSCGLVGLCAYLLAIGFVSWRLLGRGELISGSLGRLGVLVLAWCLLKAALEWVGGAGLQTAFLEAAVLGGRLLALVLLGLCLTAVTSLAQLGRGAAGFLRPLPGDLGWRAALGLSLMIHFLPLCLKTFRQARLSLSLRAAGLPPWVQLRLFVQTVLRVLAGRTWDQTLVLASRGLDRPEIWQEPLPFSFRQWLIGFCLAVLAFSLSVI